MSSIHESDEVFLPVEEEGQWLVIVGADSGYQVYVGPFVSALDAGTWGRAYAAGDGWGVTMLVHPADFPGAAAPAVEENSDSQGEFFYTD